MSVCVCLQVCICGGVHIYFECRSLATIYLFSSFLLISHFFFFRDRLLIGLACESRRGWLLGSTFSLASHPWYYKHTPSRSRKIYIVLDSNSGPRTCKTSTRLTELFLQPQPFVSSRIDKITVRQLWWWLLSA